MNTLSTGFIDALYAERPAYYIPDEQNIFDFLIGEWDFVWYYHKDTKNECVVRGEWIIKWVMGGTAIQDVFRCPVINGEYIPNSEHSLIGGKMRVYNAEKRKWEIFYVCNGQPSLLEAKKVGNNIVLDSLDIGKNRMKWIYSDIKGDTFSSQAAVSKDNGKTWVVQGELKAKRRK